MVEDATVISYIDHAGERLAVDSFSGASPGLFFMTGLASDMTGSKAVYLRALAQARGLGFTRFDYSGHGQSSGKFVDGSLDRWLSDALAVFDAVTTGPQIVIGSSMGGWLALHLALKRSDRMKGLIGIAPAPDFTQDLVEAHLTQTQRAEMERQGLISVPSPYGAPTVLTKKLIESGRDLLLLKDDIAIQYPVRLLHGMQDKDVPWNTSLRLADKIASTDVQVTLIKDGGHRLSRDSDMAQLEYFVAGLI